MRFVGCGNALLMGCRHRDRRRVPRRLVASPHPRRLLTPYHPCQTVTVATLGAAHIDAIMRMGTHYQCRHACWKVRGTDAYTELQDLW